MISIKFIALLIMMATFVISYIGIKDAAFFRRYALDADRISEEREYYRIITSGFLHNGWLHLVVNFVFLFATVHFAGAGLHAKTFFRVYFLSIISSNVLLLTSGTRPQDIFSSSTAAVSGIAMLAFLTEAGNAVMNIASLHIPYWCVATIYLAGSCFSYSGKGAGFNHQLVMGGALTALVVILFTEPLIVKDHTLIFLSSLLVVSFLFILSRRNSALMSLDMERAEHEYDYYHSSAAGDEEELNRLLEKVNKKGFESLSRKEKKKLEELSKKI